MRNTNLFIMTQLNWIDFIVGKKNKAVCVPLEKG